ncbi:MAG: extracellular solute-binding protein [Anaerolineae bacterium]
MNRRRFLTALAGLAASAALPGCSGLTGLTSSGEPVSIRSAILPGVLPFTRTREVRKVFEAWAEEISTTHPLLEVTLEELGYEDLMSEEGRFALDMLFGEDSDFDCLMTQSSMLAQLRDQKLIAPLDSYLQGSAAVERDDYLAPLMGAMEYEGQTWGLPAAFNPLVIRYNRSLFEQLGVPEPSMGWTWEQILETVALLKAGLPDRQFALAAGPSDLVLFLYALGGRVFDDPTTPKLVRLDETATVNAFMELASLMERGTLPDPEQVSAYEWSNEDSDTVQSFAVSVMGAGDDPNMADFQAIADYSMRLSMAAQNGDVAMWFAPLEEGQSMNLGAVRAQVSLPDRAGETGVVLLPRGEKMVTLAETTVHSLVAASKKQKEAWPWLEFLASKLPPVGLPPRRSLLLAPESVSQMSADAAAVAQAMAEHLDGLDIISTDTINAANPVAQALWKAWTGKAADEALAEAAETLQQYLDEAQAAQEGAE